MSVGLYDMDIATYLTVPPNLEIMKLSTFYKRRREVVVLSPTFSPEKNKEFFMRKDYNDGLFPKDISKANYGGLAFTNNVYEPLPLEIETCMPDPYIYLRYRDKIINESPNKLVSKKLVHDIFSGEHLRLSLDGKNIWEDYSKQFHKINGARSIIFHDYNLAEIEGADAEVGKIIELARKDKVPPRIGTKFPIQVYDKDSLMKWAAFPTNSLFFGIIYHGLLSNEDFLTYIKSDFDRNSFNLTTFNVTHGWSSENDFIEHGLPKILEQAIFSRIYNAKISLTYDENFFFDQRWGRVIDLFGFFIKGAEKCHIDKLAGTTLFEFCKFLRTSKQGHSGQRYITKEEARDTFRFVREKSPALFEKFYNCSYITMQGGSV